MAGKGLSWGKLDDIFCETQMKKINKRLKDSGGGFDSDMLEYVRFAFELGRQYERRTILGNLQRNITKADKVFEEERQDRHAA